MVDSVLGYIIELEGQASRETYVCPGLSRYMNSIKCIYYE